MTKTETKADRPPLDNGADERRERQRSCGLAVQKVLDEHRCAITAYARVDYIGEAGDEARVKAIWNLVPLE